jgi:hypothetical protein
VSRPSNTQGLLPQIAQNSASRQQFLKNARAANSQSALSLYKDFDPISDTKAANYPFANLAAKRKIMRMQHLISTGNDPYSK